MHQANHWKRWRAPALLALAASLVLAAACGGSDDGADTGFGGRAPEEQAARGGDGDLPGRAASGSADAPSGTAPGDDSGGQQAALLDRKLIRTATLQIEADAVSQKFEDIHNIALSAGGLVFSSSFGNDGERQTASITIRVPGDRYEATLAELRRLGDVTSEQSNATDVTAEYTDLTSQVANLQATERQYLGLLTRSGTIEEILIVQDRLNGVRAQIDQTQGRINLLSNQTELATITVHITPPIAAKATDEGGATSPLEVAEEAWEASLATLLGFAVVAIAIVAYGWWLVPVIAAGAYIARQKSRADRARTQPPPTAT